MDHLNRRQAPLPKEIWQSLDEAAVAAARERLTGRRFLKLEGPFGLGLTAIEVGNDDFCRQPAPDEAAAIMGHTLPVPMIRKSFRVSIRRLAAAIDNGQPLDLSPVEDAAEAVADREEELIYQGQPDFHVAGLLTAKGRHHIDGGSWSDLGTAQQDLIAAVTRLDEAGFHGPFALAVEPALYNSFFRLYPGTELMQIRHLDKLFAKGIYKAPVTGAVVVDSRVGSLIVGEDFRTGYISQDGIHYQLYVSESLVMRIDEPSAICTIGVAEQRRDRQRDEPPGTIMQA